MKANLEDGDRTSTEVIEYHNVYMMKRDFFLETQNEKYKMACAGPLANPKRHPSHRISPFDFV